MRFGSKCLKSPKSKPYKDNPDTLGEHLVKRRYELGMYQKDVARQLGVNEWTLISWETARVEPVVRFWPRIIDFLGYYPVTLPTTLGSRLLAKRRHLGLTQRQLGHLVSLDESAVRLCESGRRITDRTGRAVAKLIGSG